MMVRFFRYCLSVLLLFCSLGVSAANVAEKAGDDHRHTQGQVLPVEHEQQPPMAVLRDGYLGYRIASSRPVRVLPVSASGNSRTNGKLPISYKSNLLSHTLRCATLGTMPLKYRVCASLRCYFIALRHIIR